MSKELTHSDAKDDHTKRCRHEHGEHEHCHEHGEHEHGHEHGGHRQVWMITIATLLLCLSMWIEHHFDWEVWQLLIAYLVPYMLVGHETLYEAWQGLRHGDALNEHFLMTVATIGALCIGFMPGGEPEFAEAVAVMLFFQVGELFEGYAEGQSRRSIAHLMDLRPDSATVMRDGKEQRVAPESITVGETIVVSPGERVPIDGIVLDGTSQMDTAALTGESIPRHVAAGNEVLSGCINLSGVLRIQTTKPYGQSTVARIISLVQNAGDRKSKSETFIARFARIYIPIIVFAAVALALVPPLLLCDFAGLFPIWLHRALIFLVVSCPCALVISVPLTFFGGIGGASRQGILVKGANYMDTLAKVDTVVFDKTGTLTEGCFKVTSVHSETNDSHYLLHMAAHAERYSTHPIAAALKQSFPEEATDGCEVDKVEEVPGQGIRAFIQGRKISVCNSRLMKAEGVNWQESSEIGTIVHVSIDGIYAGYIVINDRAKADSAEAIEKLKDMGVKRTVMLTGDQKAAGEAMAKELKLDEWHAELLPADKVSEVERLMNSASKTGKLAFVGDGINDAPVLARADVGIAMGALGSEAAIESADVVLMDDSPAKVATAIRIARRTHRIAQENVGFAIGVKVAVLGLAAAGLATMWMAAFADVGVTVLAVLNAMRTLVQKKD